MILYGIYHQYLPAICFWVGRPQDENGESAGSDKKAPLTAVRMPPYN